MTMSSSKTNANSPKPGSRNNFVPRDEHAIFEQEKRDALRGKRLTRYEMQIAGVVVYLVGMTVLFVVAVILMLFGEGRAMHAQVPIDGGDSNKAVITTSGAKHGRPAGQEQGLPASGQ